MPNVSQNIGLNIPKKIETELGVEKLCIHCNEYWSLDSEFWFSRKTKRKNGSDGVQYEAACKCCYKLRYKSKELLKRCTSKNIKSHHERGTA